mmetsp:Transcript_20084/g.39466  ORF Transcript_20084/g.39466 Transcript_20084/m.39466 type:complete len:105 (+) Transcript_20084:1513-1827(+)
MGIHVLFYLFGGRHMLNDLLIAVTYHDDALSRLPRVQSQLTLSTDLSAVHECGVAHNDVRLNNFVVDTNQVVRVIDFGMASIGASDKMIAGDNATFDILFAFVS